MCMNQSRPKPKKHKVGHVCVNKILPIFYGEEEIFYLGKND